MADLRLERFIIRHRHFGGFPGMGLSWRDKLRVGWIRFKTRRRSILELPEYSPPTGLQEGKHIVGYLGIVGTEPVTRNGNLLMWSFRRRVFVEMKEPKNG